MINIVDLSVTYKHLLALDNLSIKIKKGSLTAVVGPNGAGKSTLLKTIMGQIKPNQGLVDLGSFTTKNIAYLPQSHQIDKSFPITVGEFVSAGAWQRTSFWRAFSQSEKKLLAQALAKVNLEETEKRQISALSGGQFQRMLFARMLLQDADILLLDEPFAAIDAQTSIDLMAVIHDCQNQGKTIITVVHDLALVSHFFPNVILLSKKLICSGATASVMTGENLSKAGYQHLAYIPHEASPLATENKQIDKNESNENSDQNHASNCSDPAHYSESAS
jgi:zinc/manganese transport system ATP-binding protein